MMQSEVWRRLSLYESSDLIESLFYERHQKKLNPTKARAIVAHIAQAREFFQSAAQASELTRPLLLYYGVLGLSRGLILFRNREGGAYELSERHGLEIVAWTENLKSGITNLGDLQIRVSKRGGAFEELGRATGNVEEVEFQLRDPTLIFSPLKKPQVGTLPIPLGLIITLKDIFGRIPDLYAEFERAVGEPTSCLHSHIDISGNRKSFRLNVIQSPQRLLTSDLVREAIPALPVDKALHSHLTRWGESFDMIMSLGSEEELLNSLPMVTGENEDEQFIIKPLAGGISFSQLLLQFQLAYLLGMFVRYYPGAWLSLIGRNKGDRFLPLFRSASSIIESRFPKMILAEFEKKASSAGRA